MISLKGLNSALDGLRELKKAISYRKRSFRLTYSLLRRNALILVSLIENTFISMFLDTSLLFYFGVTYLCFQHLALNIVLSVM